MKDAAFCFVLKSPPQLIAAGEGVEALLGYTREDFLAAKVQLQDRIHPEDSVLAESMFAAESKKTSGTLDLRIRHADGRIRCCKARFVRKRARTGPPQLALTLEDARQVREPGDAQLVASFKSLIEQTSDYILLKNRNHVILAASLRVPEFTESAVQADELAGKTDYDLRPEEVADRTYRLESRAIAEGERVNEFQQVQMQDGSKRWIDNRKYPINGPDGEVAGVLGIAPDITEQIESRLKLRESEESLRQAQKIAGLGSYILDIASGTWTCSEIMYEVFGIGRAYEHTIAGWQALLHPGDRAAMLAYFQQVVAQGKLFDQEYRIIRHSDGAVRWLHGRGELAFDADGRVVTMHGTIQDITERKQAEAELRESKDLLQLFVGHAPAALAMFDREMRYLAVSRRWLEMHSLGDAAIIGHSHYEFFPKIPEHWREEHRRCLAGEKLEASERELTMADASLRWVRREILPWRAGDGSIGGIVIFAEDITERKQTEERLRLAATVFTNAREGILIVDPSGAILEVNDTYTRMTGYTRDELRGKNPRILQSGLHSKEYYKSMWDSLVRDGLWSGEIWNRTKSGDIYPEMLNIHAIRDAAGRVKQYVGLSIDISEIKKQEKQLALATQYDALTGLPNRALFADRLRQAMAQTRRRGQLLGVASFDLDGFKAINDRYGQASGDALLTAVASRMKRVLHEGDTLARLGGDEFAAVILDLPDSDACLTTLTRMLAAAAEPVRIGDIPLRVTASAGVAFYPQPEEVDADMLLRQAGQALYEAKIEGKDRYSIFDPSQDLITRSRMENIEHIRRALAANEFVLHYQPKVNMRAGVVIGAEALLRWQHPERGLLPPGMFLPVIENHPLTVAVGQWVIENALRQMESWMDDGFEIPVSVNVSAVELQQPDFTANLCARLAAHPRIQPSNLELEVIETSALQNVTLSSQVLAACRVAGVLISVDDFGTGYSSLAYLKQLPADVLKIDQSFVRDMLEEPESLTILKGVLGLAEAFRRQVIAEGVETVEHGLMLLQLGCDCAQGYGIARPMPAKDLPAWAAGWRADPRWIEVPVVQTANRAALFALAEHRAWLGNFLGYLQGARTLPPALDPEPCSISVWLDAQKLALGGVSPSIQAIDNLHRQLHERAAQVHAAHTGGLEQDEQALLRQLRYLHERCLKRLQPFTRISLHKASGSIAIREPDASLDNNAA